MKTLILAMIIACACPAFSKSTALKGYRDLSSKEQASKNIVKNPSFLEGAKHWKMRSEYSIGNWGPNATLAIKQTRVKGKKGRVTYQRIKLKPNTAYRFGAMMRTDNLKMKSTERGIVEGVASVGVDWYLEGKWVWGMMTCNMNDVDHGCDEKWTKVTYNFTTPKNPKLEYLIFPYMSEMNISGTAYWTNIFIEEAKARCDFFMVYPKTHSILDNDLNIEIGLNIIGEYKYPQERKPELRAFMEIANKNGQILEGRIVSIENNRISIKPDTMPAGQYTLNVKLIDSANKYILASDKFEFQRIDPSKRPQHYTTLRYDGTMLVDGKPFMPVGLYCDTVDHERLKNLKGTAFNTLTPYQSLSMNMSPAPKYSEKAVRDSLDACVKAGIKLTFGLSLCADHVAGGYSHWNGLNNSSEILKAAVEKFKNHPAIIGWYISDEPAPVQIQNVTAMRQKVNRLDPWHPTWAVFNIPDVSAYAKVADILSVDPYPIRSDKHDQAVVQDLCSNLKTALCNKEGSGALWVVPQIMNWAVYEFPANQKKFKPSDLERYKKLADDPTEHEMLAMSLLAAINGAKGFIFFKYEDLLRGPDKTQFKRRWPAVCKMAKTLADQQNFILSSQKAPEIKLNIIEGKVHAKAFKDEAGNVGVFVSGIGPGISEAEIIIDSKEPLSLKSVCGNSKQIAPNKYLFKGKGICGDILR